MEKKTIINDLKEACKKRKTSMSQLARELGYSGSYVSSVFAGDLRYEPSDMFINAARTWLDKCWVCKKSWNKQDDMETK